MTDLEKLVEQWMSKLSIQDPYNDGLHRIWAQDSGGIYSDPISPQDLADLCRLAMAYAAEEAAKVCEELAEAAPDLSEGSAAYVCAAAIRERFKS